MVDSLIASRHGRSQLSRRRLLTHASLAAGGLMTGLLPRAVAAAVRVDITQGNVQPMPIALPDFLAGAPSETDIARNVTGIITGNLQRSGLFAPIDPRAFTERITNSDAVPGFADWRVINAQALVTGRITKQPDGRLKAEFRLWDVFAGQQLDGKQYFTTPDNWRRIAHIISDAIYERLTGEKGYFDTRVVFVAESGPKIKRVRRLAIMDQDGANPSYMTDGAYQVFTPRFSANDQEITFMALRDSGASIYLFNIQTGRQETLGHFSGMVFAPRFSPDGTKVALSIEKAGNTDVYIMDLRSREVRRLTTDPGIDTSPSFSPDGAQIVFNSDRGGGPQIYVMGADGSGQHRISFGDGRYTTPVWSPRGDLIMFSRLVDGAYEVYTVKPDGRGWKRLTFTLGNDAHMAWSPDGEYIVFTSSRMGFKDEVVYTDAPQPYGEIFVMRYDGTGVEQLTDNQWEDGTPAWQPLAARQVALH